MPGRRDVDRLELTLALPREWDISPKGLQNPSIWEPIKLLKILARYPHANRTYFEKGHTIPLGDEQLLSPMNAALLMPPVLIPESGRPPRDESVRIQFLAVDLFIGTNSI